MENDITIKKFREGFVAGLFYGVLSMIIIIILFKSCSLTPKVDIESKILLHPKKIKVEIIIDSLGRSKVDTTYIYFERF